MNFTEIENVFEFVRNGASIKQSDSATGIPITRIETIWNSSVDVNRFGYADINDESYSKYYLELGDILMSHINSPKHLGKCAIYEGYPEILIHGMNLLGLRPIKSLSVPKYLFFYLNSRYFKQQVNKISNQSVNQASFSSGNLKKLKIPLPPLEEQKKIAEILDTADSLRQKDQQLVEHYDLLSQSLFLDMFGDPVMNPMGWETNTLSSFFDDKPRLGTTTPATTNGTIKVVRVGEIGKKTIEFDKCKFVSLDNKQKEKCLLHEGDIVLARAIGSITHLGKASLFKALDYPVVFDSHVMRLRFKQNILNSVFFYHWMKSHGGRTIFLKNSGQTAVQFNINAQQISGIEISVPSIDIQSSFVEKINEIEKQKELAQQSLKKSDNLFNSLLQSAFKGELTKS